MKQYRKKPVVINAMTFDEMVQYGLNNAENIVNGKPWSFKINGHPVTHENDECYIITTLGKIHYMTPKDMLIVDIQGEVAQKERDLKCECDNENKDCKKCAEEGEMTENKINLNKLLHTMLTDDCQHVWDRLHQNVNQYKCKLCKKEYHNFNAVRPPNPDYLADRRNTTTLILEEAPKRYLSLWIDFLKAEYNKEIKKTDNKDMLTPELLIAWGLSIVASPIFLTDFLKFAVEWFKAHDDKCEECDGEGDFIQYPENNKGIVFLDGEETLIACPICHGTGKRWHSELKIIGD